MKRFSWKKVVSLVLVAALIFGGLHFGSRTVSAEEEPVTAEENLITGQEGHVVEDYEVPAVQYSFDRKTVSDLDSTNGSVNIVLVIDASNSMVNNKIKVKDEDGKDVEKTRLALAKKES